MNAITPCTHRYNAKLRSAAAYADEVMASRQGRTAGSTRGRRKRPGAMKARDAEQVCFRIIDGMTAEQFHHLTVEQCDDCRTMRRTVIDKWAQLNLHLQQRHIPTIRSVSSEQFLRDVSDRQAAKLKSNCEALLRQHDVIAKHEKEDYEAQLFASCFGKTAR